MKKKAILAFIAFIFLGIILFIAIYNRYSQKFDFSLSPSKKTSFYEKPYLLGETTLKERGKLLTPQSLWYEKGKLYVSFSNFSHIEVFNLKKKEKDFLKLKSNPKIGSLASDKKSLYFTDLKTQEIVFVNKKTLKEERYGFLPQNKGRLNPRGIYWFKGSVYVSDQDLKMILIISTENVKKIRERGELILTAPSFFHPEDKKFKLSSPQDVLVTPDGIIMVADKDKVMVYTCNGNFAYFFPEEKSLKEAVDIDYDLVFQPQPPKNPKISQDIMKRMGRIHILDKKRGEVVVYNPFADKKLFTYGKSEKLKNPASLAIARDLRLIFIADSGNKRIVVYGY